MKKISILYETAEGHTQEVAERIAATLNAVDCQTTVVRAKNATKAMLAEADAILLGGSIHAGRHNGKLVRFTEKHRDLLGTKPTAFFLVCLTAKDQTPEAQTQVADFLKDFEKRSGFSPVQSTAFAGALKYTKYNFLKRALMKSIASKEGGDIDTTKDFIYTDWDAVDKFAEEFLERLG